MNALSLRTIARLLVLPIGVLIAFLSLAPVVPDPNGGIPLLRWIADAVLGDPSQNDKIGHFLAYTALAGTAGFGFRANLALAAGLSFLYGAAFEALQGLTPNRVMSAADLLANGLGVAVGTLAALAASTLLFGDRS